VRPGRHLHVLRIFEVVGACGHNLAPFSAFEDEKGVLIEGISNFQVPRAENFDAQHLDVQIGEVREGLKRVGGRVGPDVAMLEGSLVKASTSEAYRKWQGKEQRERENTGEIMEEGALDLEFEPFTEEEWKAQGKLLPKKDRERRMSTLGKGTFMATFRKHMRVGGGGME
jgi:hypothetical protein